MSNNSSPATKVLYVLLIIASCTKSTPESAGVTPSGSDAVTLKVGSYNLWTSDSRKKYLTQYPEVSRQRYWKPSSGAMLAMVKDMDCDVFAFQEICDSIYGKKGNASSLKNLLERDSKGYVWAIWSNVDGARVTASEGKLSYSPGICYKSAVLTLLEGGVFWLGGNPDVPEFVRTADFDPEYGDPKRACVWARFRHNASGKIFYLLSAHLDTQSFGGVSYPVVNKENCKNLMTHADKVIVPTGIPSIIAGDMNASPSNDGYKLYLNKNSGRLHKWFDVCNYASASGLLGPGAAESQVTMNSYKETMGSSRIDHIFVDGFTPLSYDILRDKYPTLDSSLHWQSDHFPVVVTLALD